MKKIIVLFICFYGVYANAQPFMLDQITGIVGGKAFKQSDVEERYKNYRIQGIPMQGDMKCMIFEELLTEKLLINQAEVDSLVVEPSEVEMALDRTFDYYQRMGYSIEDIERQYNKSIFEIKADMRPDFYNQKLAEKMKYSITDNVTITPSEVRSFYNKLHRDSIPLIQGQAEVAQIAIYPPYNDEAISEVRQRLLELRGRIINGERFSALATLYSEDPMAARDGGDLGFQSRGELDPEFAKAAWALKSKGDVSRIVESKFGYHIIQLEEKRGDQVRCRHILMTPKPNPEAIATATGTLDSLLRVIRKEPQSWNSSAFRYSQDENTRFNGGLMINPRNQSTLFEMDQFERVDYEMIKDLKVGEISEVYQSRDEKNRIVYKIVKLKDRSDPHRANLKEDYSFLQDMALNEKMLKIIGEWVAEKIETSYIYIDESFKRCGLSYNWFK